MAEDAPGIGAAIPRVVTPPAKASKKAAAAAAAACLPKKKKTSRTKTRRSKSPTNPMTKMSESRLTAQVPNQRRYLP